MLSKEIIAEWMRFRFIFCNSLQNYTVALQSPVADLRSTDHIAFHTCRTCGILFPFFSRAYTNIKVT